MSFAKRDTTCYKVKMPMLFQKHRHLLFNNLQTEQKHSENNSVL